MQRPQRTLAQGVGHEPLPMDARFVSRPRVSKHSEQGGVLGRGGKVAGKGRKQEKKGEYARMWVSVCAHVCVHEREKAQTPLIRYSQLLCSLISAVPKSPYTAFLEEQQKRETWLQDLLSGSGPFFSPFSPKGLRTHPFLCFPFFFPC